MSTYKSCWSWSVSQFSTCMSLLRHGCQRNSFWNSQTDSQMCPFPDQMNWQFVQVLMGSTIPLKTSCTGHRWRKAKYFFVFCSGKICLVSFQGCSSFILRHLCPVHKINAPTPITTILTTHLLHEFIVTHLTFLFAVWIFFFYLQVFFSFFCAAAGRVYLTLNKIIYL